MRHFVFKDMETNEHPEELKDLQFFFVELAKFHKDWPEVGTLLERWIAFLTKGEGMSSRMLPSALAAEPAIARAVAELERMSNDPELREVYEAEEKARMVDVAELQYAEERGMERGMEQGLQRGIQRGQQHLLRRQMTRRLGDLPASIAARLDTLPPDKLDELGEALFDIHSYADVDEWFTQQ